MRETTVLNSRMQIKSVFRHKILVINCLLLFLLIGLITIITFTYISNEKTFYPWDYANYSDKLERLNDKWTISPLKVAERVIDSLGNDYTDVPSLFVLPFRLLLGSSRFAFILGLAFVYLLSFSLMMGYLAIHLIAAPNLYVFWSTAFLTVLIPTVWVPILRGYPDIGSVAIIAFAMTIHWKDFRLKHTKTVLLIAGLISASVFFRRHFAYSFRAYFFAIIADIIWFYLSSFNKNRLSYILKLSLIQSKRIIFFALMFVVFSPVLVFKSIFINYRLLYASYEVSILDSLSYYSASYGLLIWILAGLGFWMGWSKFKSLRKARFLILFQVISLVQWLFLSRQLGVHYTTHFAIFIVLGISALLWKLLTLKSHLFACFLVIFNLFVLIINQLLGLTSVWSSTSPMRMIFARSEPSLYRSDYDEFARLISYLKSIQKDENKDLIYLGASSWDLNSSLIKAGGSYLNPPLLISVIGTSDIDSRDVYPLNRLLKARYVVIASPVQYHLNPSEQKVVKVVVDAFTQSWRFARDFKQLPVEFKLKDNMTVKIYERVQSASVETILDALEKIRSQVTRSPGQETYWLTLESGQETNINQEPYFNKVTISPIPIQSKSLFSLLYFGTLPKNFELLGRISNPDCSDLNQLDLHWTFLNRQGNTLATQKQVQQLPQNRFFSLVASPPPETVYLRLDLGGQGTELDSRHCVISLSNIEVLPRR